MNYEEMLEEALSKIERKETKQRFQKPVVQSIVQSNKTIIKNFGKIADYLRRDRKHLAKYLMQNLAAPGVIQGDSLILNSRISSTIIQKKLDNYIKDYVICKVCGSADTRLEKEGRILYLRCEACGAKYPVFK